MPRKPALEGQELKKAVEMKKQGASYGKIAEEFDVSKSVVHRNVKDALESGMKRSETEKETEREPEQEAERSETERLTNSQFHESLELFINGKNSEQIADHLDVSQEAVEYELLPYVSELKTARRLQKRFEEEVKCRI